MIKLITFDLDNTLWPVNEVILRANKKLMVWLDNNHSQITNEVSSEEFMNIREQILKEKPAIVADLTALRIETIERAAQLAGYPTQLASTIANEAFDVFYEERNSIEFFPHALKVLEKLSKDYQLIALTNGNANLGKIGIDHLFEASINSADAGFAKPHPKMFEMAMAQQSLKSHQCIHVGDDYVCDISPAKALGMQSVWVNALNYPQPKQILADREITTLQDLPLAIEQLNS